MKTVLPPNQNTRETINFDELDYNKPIGAIANGHRCLFVPFDFSENKDANSLYFLRTVKRFGLGDEFIGRDGAASIYQFAKREWRDFKLFQFENEKEFFQWLAE